MKAGSVFPDRKVLRVSGEDARKFLQDLVTNDLAGMKDGLIYAALLTPQGKYLADFLMCDEGDAILLDVSAGQSAGLIQRLSMYKLRADVRIAETELSVIIGFDTPPDGAFSDPRHPELGWRAYKAVGDAPVLPLEDWQERRVAHLIPEAGCELIPNDSYILEQGFERLNGVDFRKGCYVGQEVTARMKHKTELKKGLARVEFPDARPEPGTDIVSDGKIAGQITTVGKTAALAYLRFDRAGDEMMAGDARLTRL